MNLDDRYRLADGVAIRPERFGGLVYDYHTRRLYFIHSHYVAAFVTELTDAEPLGETVKAFGKRHGLSQSAIDPLLKGVSSLFAIGVVVSAVEAAA